VASRNGGIGQAISNRLDGAQDGVIPFAAKGFDGGIPHFDDFLAVTDFEARRELGMPEFFQLLEDPVFLSKQEELLYLGIVGERFQGGRDRALGSVISPHRIERNLHQKTRETTGNRSGGWSLDRENLTIAVTTCGGIDSVREVKISIFVATQLRQVTAVRCAAHAQAHLGCFAFRDSHGFSSPF
jgi:hypothetical protein